MGQFVGCVRGIGEACRALDFPIVSGNVSLYNETNGQAILPTPTIGGVGVVDDFTKSMTLAFKAEGEAILVIGETTGWLGQSIYLRDICGRDDGAPPPVDLGAERRHGDFVRDLIRDGLVTAAHDISDGGLLVALAEMAMASGIGAVLDGAGGRCRRTPSGSARIRPATSSPRAMPMRSRCAPDRPACRSPGSARPAATFWLSAMSARFASSDLKHRFEAWLPAYMAGSQ